MSEYANNYIWSTDMGVKWGNFLGNYWWLRNLTMAGNVISRPSIISPVTGSTGDNTTLTITSSAFSSVGGSTTQQSSNWQLATDSAFSNIVSESMNDTVNLTSWSVSGLSYSTMYYVRVQYTGTAYGTSAWSATDNFTTGSQPVLGIAVFGSGNSGSTYLSTTSIYSYSSNTAVAGGNLRHVAFALAAAGNSAVGVFGDGYSGFWYSSTSVYTYSSNSAIAGGNLTYPSSSLAAVGNSTLGVFGGGYNNGYVSNTALYTYNSNIAVSGVNLSSIMECMGAVGNSSTGVFGGGDTGNGNIISNTSLYTYSSNSTVAGGNLMYSANFLAAAGNTVIGVFGGGLTGSLYLSTTSIYTYSSNIAIAGGNLSYVVDNLAAAGNATIGVFGAGDSNGIYLSTTSVYTYSTNTAIAGGNLNYVVYSLSACGPNPGVNA